MPENEIKQEGQKAGITPQEKLQMAMGRKAPTADFDSGMATVTLEGWRNFFDKSGIDLKGINIIADYVDERQLSKGGQLPSFDITHDSTEKEKLVEYLRNLIHKDTDPENPKEVNIENVTRLKSVGIDVKDDIFTFTEGASRGLKFFGEVFGELGIADCEEGSRGGIFEAALKYDGSRPWEEIINEIKSKKVQKIPTETATENVNMSGFDMGDFDFDEPEGGEGGSGEDIKISETNATDFKGKIADEETEQDKSKKLQEEADAQKEQPKGEKALPEILKTGQVVPTDATNPDMNLIGAPDAKFKTEFSEGQSAPSILPQNFGMANEPVFGKLGDVRPKQIFGRISPRLVLPSEIGANRTRTPEVKKGINRISKTGGLEQTADHVNTKAVSPNITAQNPTAAAGAAGAGKTGTHIGKWTIGGGSALAWLFGGTAKPVSAAAFKVAVIPSFSFIETIFKHLF